MLLPVLLLLLGLTADAYHIQSQSVPGHQMGGQPVLAQGEYPPAPMMMGGPFLEADYDPPEVNTMYGMPPPLGYGDMNYVAYPGGPVLGAVMPPPGQPGLGAVSHRRLVHQPGLGGAAHHTIAQPHVGAVNYPHHTVVQPGVGTAQHTVAQSHGGVSHSGVVQPAVSGQHHTIVQSHVGAVNPTMGPAGGGQHHAIAQAQAGNPVIVHGSAGTLNPTMTPRGGAVNPVVAHSPHTHGGAPVNPPGVQQSYGAGSPPVAQRPQHTVNPVPTHSHHGPVNSVVAQTRVRATNHASAQTHVNPPGPQHAHSAVNIRAGPPPRGPVHHRGVQPSAIPTRASQPTARVVINPRPNPAGVGSPLPQPSAVPVSYRGAPQRVRTAGLVPRGLSRPGAMRGGLGMRHGGLGLRRPFPRDGTYKTARGEFTRDGSDLSFEPRY